MCCRENNRNCSGGGGQGNRIKKVTVSYVFQSFSSPSSPNASIGDPFQPWISDKTFGNDDFFYTLKGGTDAEWF